MKPLEIGNNIINRIEAENRDGVSQLARGYVEMTDGAGRHKIIWLIQGELKRGYSIQCNIVGDIIGTASGESPYLRVGGVVLSKNTPFGNALAELVSGIGAIRYPSNGGLITATINAKAEYAVNTSILDANHGSICCEEEDDEFLFEDSLRTRLKDLQELYKAKKKESVSEEEVQALQEQIQALEEEIASKAKSARRYRRTTTSIRQQFMLDADQNRIKRLKLFAGPLVISGGPGTGKTTLLIHKIQYMLDPEVENDENLTVKLTNEEKSFIRNQKTGWIFFSPTDLLKKYLEDAMTAEGLEAHNDTVKTWHQQRNALKTSLGLFNADTSRPFLSFTDKEYLWSLNAKEVNKLLKAFDQFFISQFQQKIDKTTKINLTNMPWRAEGSDIANSLNAASKNISVAKLIRVLNDLVGKYNDLRLSMDKAYKALMDRVATSIQKKLTDEDKEWFKQLLKERRTKKNEVDSDEEEQENEELVDAFEEEEVIDGKKLEIDINKLLKRIVRIEALSEIDKNTNVTKADREILNRINNYIIKEQYPQIASYSLFIKYFKPFLKGSDNTILSQLPRAYKTFRRQELKNVSWLKRKVKDKLAKIIEASPKNTRIHDDELDLIILLSLRYARIFFSTSPMIFKESKHSYLATFSSFMKGLVAIDEATDFTPVQIACMYHLSRPRLNSVIMAGDIMQQMNLNGISEWEDIQLLLPETQISGLFKSYRQTPRLLNLAIKLYENRYSATPGFYASEKDNENDPPPLVYINVNFDDKINWIAGRIAELYTVYENVIPNIAVFVKNDEEIQSIAQALNDNETLINHAIKVKACIGEGEIGSSEFVRVFNINLIKGMEFESVFFLDVDDYDESNQDILDKLIYVGISRATYYLAITLKNAFPARLQPIEQYFIEGSWSKDIDSDY